jgi:hypothetical protein
VLKTNSKKVHPELDFEVVRRVFKEAGATDDITGELITSPHDLFSVESLRDTYNLRIGKPFSTDVFVFGKGEPSRPDCTQIGGMPYWPKDRTWPRASTGRPFLFLAQFYFADSRDLVGELPGDVLLMLVEDLKSWTWEAETGVRFEWLPMGLDVCRMSESDVRATSAGPFFGAIHRTADYPEAEEEAASISVRENYNLAVLNGTKIGGLPNFIQGGVGMGGEFLCQLGSIQAAPQVPYPWVNQHDPLDLGFKSNSIHADDNELVFVDMGCAYLFRDSRGDVKFLFECY